MENRSVYSDSSNTASVFLKATPLQQESQSFKHKEEIRLRRVDFEEACCSMDPFNRRIERECGREPQH
jgi:hypothetical protein